MLVHINKYRLLENLINIKTDKLNNILEFYYCSHYNTLKASSFIKIIYLGSCLETSHVAHQTSIL